MIIRPAAPADAPGLLDVKRQLRLPADAGQAPRGGFLLGTTLAQYAHFIAHDDVLVAEDCAAGRVVGFSIVLRHASVLRSDLWQRAQRARWDENFLAALGGDAARRPFAFYEQLGCLPDDASRVFAKYLAFASVHRALAAYPSLITTILRVPVYNRAALPFLQVAGFEPVGRITEHYPEIGRIEAELFHLDRAEFQRRLMRPDFAAFLARAYRQGYLTPALLEPVPWPT